MSEHEHKFEEIEGSLYSMCKCGAVRHDRDGDVFRNVREARDTARKSGRRMNYGFYAFVGLAFSSVAVGFGIYFQDPALLLLGAVEGALVGVLVYAWRR